MDGFNEMISGLKAGGSPTLSWSLLVILPLLLLLFRSFRRTNDEPLSLPNKGVPLIGNTIQYIMDNAAFISRAGLFLQTRDVVKFYLGPLKVYLISGPQNIQAMFRKSTSLSSDKFLLMVYESVQCMTKEDLVKFASDKTGRLPTPADGVAHNGPRYWVGLHHVFAENLARSTATASLTARYYTFFQEKVQDYPLGEWTTVNLFQFMRTDMAGAATKALSGERILQRNPDFLEAFWDYDSVITRLLYSLPKWLDPKPWKIRERFHRMAIDWIREDFDPADWDNLPDVDWHPVLGLRFIREYLNWGKNMGLSVESRAGYYLGFILGLNGNSIPTATWALFELVQEPALWKAVQEEVSQAFETDPATGQHKLDVQVMLSLPLLQSVYTEALRLHVAMNISREVIEETTLAGCKLSKHSLVQASTRIAHFDEKSWGAAGHPASEFWPARNLKYSDNTADGESKSKPKAEFIMKGRPSEFFPYGGGISMCPGRHFAKQEIMATLAIIVTTFDVEMIEWVSIDGKTKSDRPAQDDLRYSGSAAMPPDRDLRVRWKRRW